MAYNQQQYNSYSGYGGNPYGDGQSGGYGTSNPYARDAGNPYGGSYGQQQQGGGLQPVQQQTSYQSAGSQYSQGIGSTPQGYDGTSRGYDSTPADAPPMPAQGGVQYVNAGPTVMSNQDFLSRVEAVKADIRTLTTHVGQIASAHQRTLSSPESGSSGQLESMVTSTQVLNTSIKDQIKFLETDAVRSKDNQVKNTQINQLKSSFQKQIQEYRQQESNYDQRYREQIARQYKIVNPEATDSEVREAFEADWSNEGVFETAVYLSHLPLELASTNVHHSSDPTARQQPTPSSAPSAPATMTSRRSSAQ